MDREQLEQAIIKLGEGIIQVTSPGRAAAVVPVESLAGALKALREEERLSFDVLLDHTAIDHVEKGQFELIYNLYSTVHGHSAFIICFIDRKNPVAPTAEGLWPIAHWQEREVYDLFGVLYDGHSDLRRVFLEDDWRGHPLRKDYQDPDMLEFPK
jgi:NADH-quinone oxidoreductase subunit C